MGQPWYVLSNPNADPSATPGAGTDAPQGEADDAADPTEQALSPRAVQQARAAFSAAPPTQMQSPPPSTVSTQQPDVTLAPSSIAQSNAPQYEAQQLAFLKTVAEPAFYAKQAMERNAALAQANEADALANTQGQMAGVLGLMAMQKASTAQTKAFRFGRDAGSGSSPYSDYASSVVGGASGQANDALMQLVQTVGAVNVAHARANAMRANVDLQYSPEAVEANKAAAMSALLPEIGAMAHATLSAQNATDAGNVGAHRTANEAAYAGNIDIDKENQRSNNENNQNMNKAYFDLLQHAPQTAVAEQNAQTAEGRLKMESNPKGKTLTPEQIAALVNTQATISAQTNGGILPSGNIIPQEASVAAAAKGTPDTSTWLGMRKVPGTPPDPNAQHRLQELQAAQGLVDKTLGIDPYTPPPAPASKSGAAPAAGPLDEQKFRANALAHGYSEADVSAYLAAHRAK
jgi:hypothetical protein